MAVFFSRLAERRPSQPVVIVTAIMTVLSFAAAYGAIALSGTKTGFALALMAVLGPIAIYWALVAPIVFPFSLFALLVPFDNLLASSATGTLTKLIAALSGLAIALWLIRTRKAVAPGRSFVMWFALLLWSIASIAWSMDPQNASIRIVTPILLFTLYGAVSLYPIDRRMLSFIVVCAIVGATCAGAYGTYVFSHGLDIRGGQRLFLANDEGTYIDPNHFSASLLVPFCLAITAFAHTRRTAARILFGVCVAAMGLGLAVAGSRGGTLGLGVAFIYMLVFSRKRLTIAFTGLSGVAIGLAFHGNVLQRFTYATSTGGAGRTDIWKVGVEAFKQHWLYGAGFGNFPLAFDQAYLAVSQNYYTRWHRDSHNIFVGFAVELGAIGLALLLSAWWTQFRSLRSVPEDDSLYPVRRALEAGIIGLFICSFFLDIMVFKYVWLAFILMALTRNAARGERAALATAHVPATPTRTPSWRFG